ncbi:MAG: lipoyl(octanoyl) transferase LipB [Candidatus Pelagibacter sp.]
MNIEIKKSKKPIKYTFAIKQMEKRLYQISIDKKKELIWILEHEEVYTGGTSYKKNEILDKSINFIKTNRGGKITYHGKGQLVFYFVINLKKRNINIRSLILLIEKTIIDTLNIFKIKTFADRKNIGIWHQNKKKVKKIASIGIKVKNWIAYHGFAINISNDLKKYNKIIPCGLNNKKISNLNKIKKQNYKSISDQLIKNFLINIEN